MIYYFTAGFFYVLNDHLRFSHGSHIPDVQCTFCLMYWYTLSFYSQRSIHYFVLLVSPYLEATLQCRVLSQWLTAWLTSMAFIQTHGKFTHLCPTNGGCAYFASHWFPKSLCCCSLFQPTFCLQNSGRNQAHAPKVQG